MKQDEKRIALFIQNHWEEKEDCLGDEYRRIYADSTFNGAVQDCVFSNCRPTDVLCLEYVKHENGRELVQLFISTPDDEGQEWFTISDLSKRDRENVIKLFDAMVAKRGFPDRETVNA